MKRPEDIQTLDKRIVPWAKVDYASKGEVMAIEGFRNGSVVPGL